ncbi:MAG: acyl-CoA dehydrogenase family protein [Mycobacteriales bacterium]
MPPEVEAFRAELRSWLATHLTDEIRALSGPLAADPAALMVLRDWQRELADASYAAIAWPVDYGGRGAGPLEQVVHAEEMDRAGAPPELNPIGMANIAPAIMQAGTEAQKYALLPRMLRGDDIWCQGFSEPEAGSDLASLRTSAVLEGEHYRVNGQKLWTTFAQVADWCELLVRTDADAPRHRGLTALLVDMRLPGIEVRPLRTLTGDYEFSEVFFRDVAVPVADRLGEEGGGWQVAMTTLNNERAGVLRLYLGVRRRVDHLVAAAAETSRRGRPAIADPVVHHALARLLLEAEYLKLLAHRSIRDALDGREAGPEASLGKLAWSELEQRLADTAVLALGAGADRGEWARARVYARAVSIAGGTTQVNKNVLAQRVLDLPRK